MRQRFEMSAVADQPSAEVAAQRAAILNMTTANLQTALAGYQHELYRRVLDELTVGSLRPVAVELGGSKLLLDDFILLGLPRAVAHDDFLRSLLFGTQRVIDEKLAADTYALSLTLPITEAQLATNPRLVLRQVAAQRRTALQDLLNEYLDAIGAMTHVEELNFVTNTRLELRLSRRLAELAQ